MFRNDVAVAALVRAGLSEYNASYDYSGRFMYGAKCFGVTVDSMDEFVKFMFAVAGNASESDEEAEFAEALSEGVRQDSMGKGFIFYWPEVQVEHFEPEAGAVDEFGTLYQ